MTGQESSRRVPTIRTWHKWIGIAIGVVLLLWVVSGIAMIAPMSPVVWGTGMAELTIDIDDVMVTPNDAVSIAGGSVAARRDAAIRSVTLRPLLDAVVYQVTPTRGEPVLVDAGTGELIAITAERAAAIASSAMPGGAPASIERIVSAPIGYNGRIPAWRVSFSDRAATEAIVAEATGEMARTQRRDRLMMVVGHYVHVFVPLKKLPGGDTTRKAAMVGTGLVALLSIVSGYWLALPARLRRRQKRS